MTRLDATGWAGGVAARRGAGPQGAPGAPSAGVVCLAKVGDPVEEGQPVLELHVDDPARLPGALDALNGAIAIGPEPGPHRRLVLDVLRP